MADSSQIHQVLMNLCTNAAQAMDAGEGVRTVSLEPRRLDDVTAQRLGLQAGPYHRLKAQDTSKGTDRGTAERIFEPFFTTKERGEGAGLGLFVVHGIVTDHGGAIAVDSTLGVGAEFLVYLPEVDAADVATEELEVSQSPRGTGRILVVDDEIAVMKMSQQLLTRLGYEVARRMTTARRLRRSKATPMASI